MKSKYVSISIMFFAMLFYSASVSAQCGGHKSQKKDKDCKVSKLEDGKKQVSFGVSGSCGMCQARIEKAALKTTGIEEAGYDLKNQELTVVCTADCALDALHENLASAGHDTYKKKAPDAVYNALPACCHYREK